MQIVNCQINHLSQPLGYQLPDPVLSYQFTGEPDGSFQKDARIVVADNNSLTNPLVDTGWQTDISPLGYQLKLDLTPRTRYYWQVQAHTDNDTLVQSAVNWFETGKEDEPWSGQWITCDSKTPRHPILSKQFQLKKPVASARLYICGLGLYTASLNNQRVSQEMLAPGCNNYSSWLQYQTYDVSDQLKADNQLKVTLGNGWYKGRFGLNAPEIDPSEAKPWELIAELHVDYADGTHEVINSDTSWKVERSNVIASGIYDGESIDDTLEPATVQPAELSDWDHAPLMARLSTPVIVHDELPVKKILHTPAGETVLDLGQNFAGTFRLRVDLSRGKQIKLQFGEHIQDGNFYRDNLRTAKQEFDYVSDGKPHVLEPSFTYYGYRYVKVTGLDEIKTEDFTGLAMYSTMPKAGQLKTGSQDINQLIHNTDWGMRSNFIDTPTDCPQRDERLGWTGDAQVFSPTATYLRDTAAFYMKYLTDMRSEQKLNDGAIPSVIPDVLHDGTTSSVWGDAACIIPWNMYQFYGDPMILKRCLPLMKDWVDFIERLDGDDHAWERHYHWGDWLALDNPSQEDGQVFGGTDPAFIADVYYYGSANITAKSAALLGDQKTAEHYQAVAKKVYQRLMDEFFAPNGRPCINTQTGMLLALKYNLTKNRPQVIKMLRTNFNDHDDKLQTGFTGTPILGDTLTEVGLSDLVYKLLFNTEFPSWLYAIKMGATTIWERWNSVMPNGHIETSMSSLNHYSYGSIIEWIWRYAAGLNQTKGTTGFNDLTLMPHYNKDLRSIDATYQSASGQWHIAWQIIDNWHVKVEITVPFNAKAQIKLPYLKTAAADQNNSIFKNFKDGTCFLTAGNYALTYETSAPMLDTLDANSTLGKIMANPRAKKLLLDLMPMVSQMPATLNDQPLKPFLLQYGGPVGIDEAKIDQLDQKLQQLSHTFSVECSIPELLDDSRSKAVVVKYLPEVIQAPQQLSPELMNESLKYFVENYGNNIGADENTLAAIQSDLAKIER